MGGADAGAPARTAASTARESPATVGASNRARRGRSNWKTLRRRDSTRVASRECPPRSKKSSWMPIRGRSSRSAQTPAISSSVGVRGETSAPPTGASGSGRARRSSLPLGVTGSSGSSTQEAGIIGSGSSSWSASRSAAGVRPGRSSRRATQATSRRAAPSPRASTTAARTPGKAPSTASISPGSTRMPRTLTWWSRRPRCSRAPSARKRARSPVRYRRPPGCGLHGSGTNRSAVSPGRSR